VRGGAAIAVAAVLPLASTTAVAVGSWALRWAMLPAIAGGGLAALIGMATAGARTAEPAPDLRRRRRGARWAIVWLAWATVSALGAPQVGVAWWGEYRVGTGLVFLTALAGAWALGAGAGRRGARLVSDALVVGCALNALVAVAEQLVGLQAFGVTPFGGRSSGLYGNPVYLAELLCGGLWLALCSVAHPPPTASRARHHTMMATAVLITAGIELSGSRSALVLAVLVTAVMSVGPCRQPAAGCAGRDGSRRSPDRRAPSEDVVASAAGSATTSRGRGRSVVVLSTVAVGLVLGAGVGALAPGSTTSTGRVAADTGGYSSRLHTWAEGLSALRARPVLGWGPGGFLAAAGPRRSLAVARAEGPETLFADAHDLVIESVVTTGPVGAVLLGLWLTAAFGLAGDRRHRPSNGTSRTASTSSEHPGGAGLGGFAGLVLAASLVEPMHPGVTPLALLALGSASSGALPRAATRARGLHTTTVRSAAAAVTAGGVAVSCWLVAGLISLHHADVGADPAGAAEAARRLPPVGEPAAVAGRLIAFRGITRRDSTDTGEARRWWTIAAHQDPASPSRWNDLGDALGKAGGPTASAAAYRRALADNPWSVRALRGLVRVGRNGDVDPTELDRSRQRIDRVAPGSPPRAAPTEP